MTGSRERPVAASQHVKARIIAHVPLVWVNLITIMLLLHVPLRSDKLRRHNLLLLLLLLHEGDWRRNTTMRIVHVRLVLLRLHRAWRRVERLDAGAVAARIVARVARCGRVSRWRIDHELRQPMLLLLFVKITVLLL